MSARFVHDVQRRCCFEERETAGKRHCPRPADSLPRAQEPLMRSHIQLTDKRVHLREVCDRPHNVETRQRKENRGADEAEMSVSHEGEIG